MPKGFGHEKKFRAYEHCRGGAKCRMDGWCLCKLQGRAEQRLQSARAAYGWALHGLWVAQVLYLGLKNSSVSLYMTHQ